MSNKASTFTLRPYTAADKATWNAFNKAAKNGIFMFDRDYMDYHADRFKDNSLMFYEDGKLIALLPLNLVEIDSKEKSCHDLSEAKYLKDFKEYSNDSQNLHFTESTTKNKDASHTLSMTTNTTQNKDASRFALSMTTTPESKTQKILYSHQGLSFGGFITDSSMRQHKMLECFALLRNYMRAQNIQKLIYKALPYIYHTLPAQEDIYALFVNNARVSRTDCSSTIWLGAPLRLNKGRKAQIARALKNNVEITQSSDFETFVRLLNDVLSERHSTKAVHNSDELVLLHSRFSQNILLFSALLKGEMVAASLIFEYENIAHTQYLCASRLGRQIGALDLLLKWLIERYAGRKMYFDFGISNEQQGRYLNEGLIAQKESFGARSVAYVFYEMSLEAMESAVNADSVMLSLCAAKAKHLNTESTIINNTDMGGGG